MLQNQILARLVSDPGTTNLVRFSFTNRPGPLVVISHRRASYLLLHEVIQRPVPIWASVEPTSIPLNPYRRIASLAPPPPPLESSSNPHRLPSSYHFRISLPTHYLHSLPPCWLSGLRSRSVSRHHNSPISVIWGAHCLADELRFIRSPYLSILCHGSQLRSVLCCKRTSVTCLNLSILVVTAQQPGRVYSSYVAM